MKSQLLMLLVAILTSSSTYAAEFYIGALGGANFMNNDTGFIDFDMNTGYAFGAYCGYRFDYTVRLEGEIAFRRNIVKDFKIYGDTYRNNGQIEIVTYMGNLIYEIPLQCLWTPYLGIGIGWSQMNDSISWEYIHDSYSITKSFAWQAIVGICYPVVSCIDLGVEYRYLHPGTRLDDHALALSFKCLF